MRIPADILEDPKATFHNVVTAFKDQFFDLRGLSAYSGIPKSTLRSYIAAGYFPAYKPKGTVLIRKSEFDSWVERSRIVPDLDRIVAGIKQIV